MDAAHALERLREKLLDLTLKNRLLNFRAGASSIEIIDEVPRQVFEVLVARGRSMILEPAPEPVAPSAPPVVDFESPAPADPGALPTELPARIPAETPDDSPAEPAAPAKPVSLPSEPTAASRHRDNRLQTDLPADTFDHRLRRILTDFREANESSGVNLLHLAIGFLEWSEEPGGKRVQAPLILVPLSLERRRTRIGKASSGRGIYRYTHVVTYDGEDLSPNISLAARLANDFGLDLPGFEAEDGSTEETLDVEAYLELVSETLADHPATTDWKVERRMLLGFFSFAKHRMHLDLDPARWPEGTSPLRSELVQDVLLGREPTLSAFPTEREVEKSQVAGELPLVLDADGSQYASLLHAIRGHNLVIEGPPGTGKSQTITNLIACALDRGKRVLFLSEKLAALQVVRRKLDDVSLGTFCLELHSHKAKMPLLLQDLRERLELSPDSLTGSRDPTKRLARKRQVLDAYIDVIRQPRGPFEERIEEILWKGQDLARRVRERLAEGQTARVQELEAPLVESPSAADLERASDSLEHVAAHLEDGILEKARPWRGFEAGTILPADREEVERHLTRALETTRELRDDLEEFLVTHGLTELPRLGALEALHRLSSADYQPPASWNPGLAETAWSGPREREQFDRFLELLDRMDEILERAPLISRAYTLGPEAVEELENDLRFLGDAGPDLLRLGDLPARRPSLEAARALLAALRDLSPESAAILELRGPRETLGDLERELELQAHLKRQPGTESDLYPPSFLEGNTGRLLEEALREKEDLLGERESLEEHFSLRDAPRGEDLRALRRTLRASRGSLLGWWPWGEAARARRTLKTFTRASRGVDAEAMLERLERLELFEERLGSFESRADLRESLGSAFRGAESDWEFLEAAVPWARKLLDSVEPEVAVDLLARRGELAEQRETLERATAPVETLLELLSDLRSSFSIRRESPDLPPGPGSTLGATIDHLDRVTESLGRLEARLVLDADSAEEPPEELAASLATLREGLSTRQELADSPLFPLTFLDEFEDYPLRRDGLAILAGWSLRLESLGLPRPWQSWLLRVDPGKRIEALARRAPGWRAGVERVEAALEPLREFGEARPPCPFSARWLDRDVLAVEHGLEACLHAAGQLLPWANYCRVRRQARESGAGALVTAGEEGELPPPALVDALHLALYDRLGRRLLEEEEILATFDRVRHERTRKEFRSTDREALEWNRLHIARGLLENEIPPGNSKGRVREWSELALIRRECDKKRRHVPIRQLVRRAGQALQALKPCWMMSPLSIAQFLAPGEIEFDLVVMDEASQIRPEDALGALARTGQVVVVGDTRQMPPTSFFNRTSEDYEDDEDLTSAEEVESILEASSKVYRPCMLRWHYRSEHHSLIEFSNSAYYDQSLVVFPARQRRHPQMGVKWHHVEAGRYHRRCNPLEAHAVVAAIVEHARRAKEAPEGERESLGVATLNLQQRDLIIELLDEAASLDEETRLALSILEEMPEPLFVKNLENVQGDERDVILISCTYGPVEGLDRVPQRFGPVNQSGGHRRLNVLFTRARRRTEVFSSLRPDQIEGGEEKARGVNDLKRYLEFARSRAEGEEPAGSETPGDSAFELSMRAALEPEGYRVLSGYGVSGTSIDLVVLDPGDPESCLLGIESDGPTYHSIRSSRDRERLREEVLERRGWSLHRVWSTDWFTRGPEEKRRLLQALSSMQGRD